MNTVTASPVAAAPARAPAHDGLIDVRLSAIRYAARDTNLYEFVRLDGAPLPDYEPGAHIDVHLPNGIVRQYSLINPERDPATYTVGIKRDPASRGGSRYIHDELRVGKTLKISAPRNNFPLKEDAERVILFAGGIGITPIWCMVQRLATLNRRGSCTTPAARAPTRPFSSRSRRSRAAGSISTTRAAASSSTLRQSSQRRRRARISIAAGRPRC